MRLSSKLILLFSSLLLVAGGLYFFLQKSKPTSTDQWLSTIDSHLQSKNYLKASKLLLQSKKARMNISRYDWLRVIKRTYEISKHTENYSILEKISLTAISKLPKTEELWAFYTQSLLKQNKFEKAKKAAYNINSDEFFSLRNEAFLTSIHPLAQFPLQMVQNHFSKTLDASYFQIIAQEIKNSVLFYDAALLWLKEGNTKHACAILPQIGINRETPPLGRAYIAYNCGNIKKLDQELKEILATNSFNNKNLFDTLFLQANLLLATGQYANSYIKYLKAKALNPQGNWYIYQNLAILSWQDGRTEDAYIFLKEGLELFPFKKSLLLTYSFYFSQYTDVLDLLDEYLRKHPSDPEINIRQISLSHQQIPKKTQTSLLWKIFENNPTSKNLVAYMIWFFLSNNNVSDAKTVLNEYRNHGGNTNWSQYYQGYILVAENKFEQALQLFTISNNERKIWARPYNQGIIYLHLKDYDAAFEAFTQAKEYYNSHYEIINNSPKMLSKIYSQLAFSRLKNRMNILAITLAEQALSMDPKNTLAQHIIQKEEGVR